MSRAWLWLLLIIAAFTWFVPLDYNALVRPDEGRYAEIPREMVSSGDWNTPRLNGIKYFEKPALQYWATAAAYTLFGEHNWTARLWSALTGFLGILLVYFTGMRLFGREAGLMAALVLGSSFLYVMLGHINILDMGVSFFMGLTLAAMLLAQRDGVSAQETRGWMYVCWAGMGLSMLSKGLIGVALPGAVLVLYTLIQRDWALWKRLHLGAGLLIFLAIAAPWFITVSIDNPEFPWFFFVHEHFMRFLTTIHGRVHPWYTFIPVVMLGILPWLLPMFDGLWRAWRSEAPTRGQFAPRRMLLIWVVFIFLFFSKSDSKLVPYILPIFPALALLIGDRLSRIPGRTLFWQLIIMLPIAVAALVSAPLAVRAGSAEVPASLYASFVPWIQAAAASWLAGTLLALWFSHHHRVRPAVISLALAGLLAGQLTFMGYNALAPASSAYNIAQQIKPYLRPGVPFYSVGMYEQTLPPYIERTVTLVAHTDEMAFGLEQEPKKWIPTVEAWKKIWMQQPYALAVMSPSTYDQFVQERLPMRLIARDTRRAVVTTP
ncbi:4-amino-4-deoxy-L-arabinose transferase [Sulfuriferula plumbiphila]|uniref:4-amino-4-deoxy-L-arabinose transferase n=1 Tax=Sulfuriferula plumbiphila TaxID=171865 RepID=A0A512L465_9PROT|nr:4-amino-4-deoxy-L-arabinose transferase [Sulfuriferula plumbiphila]GEP29265.1 4-amino-4-deoxy-L-arabinose transferase [Sulfuriferula plumbiphila]